jgi:site-specific DNA-cytosine methylase
MFYGSRGAKNLQIGNAVPPILSTHLAKAILSHFMEH